MPSPRLPSLVTQIRSRIEHAKAELQQARTAEERDLLSKEILALSTRERQVRVDQRRQSALRRRWERMNGPRR
jgi:hypothetical protein